MTDAVKAFIEYQACPWETWESLSEGVEFEWSQVEPGRGGGWCKGPVVRTSPAYGWSMVGQTHLHFLGLP